MRMIVALVTAVTVSGCSMVFVDGPSSGLPPTVYPSCDESVTFPVIDLALTALYTAAAIGANADSGDTQDRTSTTIASSLLAATFAASAYIGFSRTSSCQARRAEFAASYGRPGGGQPGYAPQPGYPPQGYAPQPGYPPQGYAPPPQGYAPPPQGYAPPPGQPAGPAAYPAPEGQTCHPQLGCQPGLVCASNLCVRPPQGPAPGSPR